MEKHLLAIPNRCTGCNRCAYACAAVKEGMFMPSKARIKINNFPFEGYSVPSVCFQCPKPDCLKACPERAILKNERGVIVVEASKCDGCGDCIEACPYGMIEQYGSGKAYKCDLCGGNPACVAECEFGALAFKEPDKISLRLRATQMKQRSTEGSPGKKRHHLALNILKGAVRVPRTPGYMG
ncbi:MAG: 4Fe-4S dicluster domain-containing protein [Proteobacteria bacterium]|nr:4Fe-4S dicluster domain-containing protein [Pseudomonadota bacterium]NIS71046.1 4Fe-4S dicluster domain-containing protein [Pseudomonadota bacterium]